jgi:hypothetical protein
MGSDRSRHRRRQTSGLLKTDVAVANIKGGNGRNQAGLDLLEVTEYFVQILVWRLC